MMDPCMNSETMMVLVMFGNHGDGSDEISLYG